MKRNENGPLTQFSVGGCALCYVCMLPTAVLIALTIYYSIAFKLYVSTTCTVVSELNSTNIKICGYGGCYYTDYYFYDVTFKTKENIFIETTTEYQNNHNLTINDTFTCYYQRNSPDSGVTYYNIFNQPFLTFLILSCILGGIPLCCCIFSIFLFPIALILEIKNAPQKEETNEIYHNPIPQSK